MKRKELNMLEGPLVPTILSYTIPIILTTLLQLLFSAADLVVVGRFRGSLAVGAVGATGALTALIVQLFMGLSVGASVSVAHAIGAKQEKLLHNLVHTAMLTALIGGTVLSVVGVVFAGPLLEWMDTPSNLLPLATTYMKIYFAGLLAIIIYDFAAAILRATGDTRGPMVYLTVSGVLNVVLNLIFVLVFRMSVEGVALATVLSQVLAAFLVVRSLMRRTDECRLEPRKLRITVAPLLRILHIGVPAGVQTSMFCIANVLIQSSLNSLGEAAVAGVAASANIQGFISSLSAFSQTSLNFTGQNVGAGQYGRVKKVLLTCAVMNAVAGIAVGNLAYRFAPQLLGIYITDSPEAIALGTMDMFYGCCFYFLAGLMEITSGCLRGMGASISSMVISLVGICGLRLLWVYTVFQIPAYHTLSMLQMIYPISWGVVAFIQLGYFFILYRRRTRQLSLNP